MFTIVSKYGDNITTNTFEQAKAIAMIQGLSGTIEAAMMVIATVDFGHVKLVSMV